jgi:hypothetical protein
MEGNEGLLYTPTILNLNVPGVTPAGIVIGITCVADAMVLVPPTDSPALNVPLPSKSIHICTLNKEK